MIEFNKTTLFVSVVVIYATNPNIYLLSNAKVTLLLSRVTEKLDIYVKWCLLERFVLVQSLLVDMD